MFQSIAVIIIILFMWCSEFPTLGHGNFPSWHLCPFDMTLVVFDNVSFSHGKTHIINALLQMWNQLFFQKNRFFFVILFCL